MIYFIAIYYFLHLLHFSVVSVLLSSQFEKENAKYEIIQVKFLKLEYS